MADCGAACVESVVSSHTGESFDRGLLPFRRFWQSYSLFELRELLDAHGLHYRSVGLAGKELDLVPRLAILHLSLLSLGHFVVFCDSDERGVRIMDPAFGRMRAIPHKLFGMVWSGIALVPCE